MKRTNEMNNKGFTLIELIIVVAIIAMLIAMIAPNLTSFLGTASDTTAAANAKSAYTAANAWATQSKINGFSTGNDTVTLTSNGTTFTVKKNGTEITEGTYITLNELFNAKEIGKDGVITVKFTNKNSVSEITWHAPGGDEATYPSASASSN